MTTPELSIEAAPPTTTPSRRQQIINFLAQHPGKELSAAEIVAGLGLPYSQTTALLSQMADEPLVSRVRRGTYVYGLETKVWAETYVSQVKQAQPKPSAKKRGRPAKSSTPAPKAAGTIVQRPATPFEGFAVAGTVLRGPNGELLLVTTLPSEMHALLG